jgi:hypothetical protein
MDGPNCLKVPGTEDISFGNLQWLLIANPPRRRNGHDLVSLVPHHAGETVPHSFVIIYCEDGLRIVISSSVFI